VSAELAARRTAAAAVLADFKHAADAFIDDETDTVPRPDYSAWAFRLAAELGSVLARLNVEDAAAGQDAAAQLQEIRALLEAFDWEFHDRQLALEQIEDIVNGAGR
jgi:hypothetical protein